MQHFMSTILLTRGFFSHLGEIAYPRSGYYFVFRVLDLAVQPRPHTYLSAKYVKIFKKWYYSVAHRHFGDVVVGITFLIFDVFGCAMRVMYDLTMCRPCTLIYTIKFSIVNSIRWSCSFSTRQTDVHIGYAATEKSAPTTYVNNNFKS